MAMLAMPMVVINMGGEMVYILEQRLSAQNIPREKSNKVLVDVIRTMYSAKFITELFKPQDIYSNTATRAIFDRLAHSSIMRLNESSMEKLYDLMTMGFKYQMMSCSSPDQLLPVTLNHLNAIKQIVQNTPAVLELVDDTIDKTLRTYGGLNMGEFHLLKQLLASFFQDRRVKVSLFLQTGLQTPNGHICLNDNGCLTEATGNIRFYNEGGSVTHSSSFQNAFTRKWEPGSDECTLGTNLYSKDSNSGTSKSETESMVAQAKLSSLSVAAAAQSKQSSHKAESKAAAKSTATAELNLLAQLMGTCAREAEMSDDKPAPKLNLFANSDPFSSSGGAKGTIPSVSTITIDATSGRKTAAAMMAELKLDGDEEDKTSDYKNNDDEEDDLLSLMDSA